MYKNTDYKCNKCKIEWEDLEWVDVSNKQKRILPECPDCPKCKKNNMVERVLINLCGGRVELYGQELKEHLVAEGKKEAKKIYASEKEYAQFIGNDRYQKKQVEIDKNKTFRRS